VKERKKLKTADRKERGKKSRLLNSLYHLSINQKEEKEKEKNLQGFQRRERGGGGEGSASRISSSTATATRKKKKSGQFWGKREEVTYFFHRWSKGKGGKNLQQAKWGGGEKGET